MWLKYQISIYNKAAALLVTKLFNSAIQQYDDTFNILIDRNVIDTAVAKALKEDKNK
jgi:hypothetical protein